ncbi:MAG TPA: hypothetical protein VGH38_20185 [Bryobacteraceae bacterium]|jgi:hypothetical protein
MSETWYRGEAVDDTPATPGSTAAHDLGDGMYLTDTQTSARAYAQLRSTDPDAQRVYAVSVDRSSLRVLDLTTDARWRQHVKPVEGLIKQANENYGRTFESFVKAYKIDLAQYDAVIGMDYVRGGKQMCLLYKGGKPTQLHVRIRQTFRPMTTVTEEVRIPLPEIDFDVRPVRVRPSGGLAEGAGTLVEFAIPLLLMLLEIWMTRSMMKRKIKEGVEKLEPQIQSRLDKLKPNIARMQLRLDEGEKAYAVVTVEVAYWKMSLGPGRASYVEPEVRLADIEITSKPVTSERSFERTESFDDNQPGQSHTIDQTKRSFEAQVFTDDELETFRNLSAEYLNYKWRLGMDPTNQVWIAEERRLRDKLVKAYGADIWFLDL